MTSLSIRTVNCFLRMTGLRPRRTTPRANISGVASGRSEKSISSSFMELIRFQSVSDFLIVDFFFTLRRLSERYYSANFVHFGMGNCHDLSSEQAQGKKRVRRSHNGHP